MLASNGSIPGPLIRVNQGASITVVLENRSGLPTSLHSHGVRMDAPSDGIAAVVGSDNGPFEFALQPPKECLAPGERAVVETFFGDAGTDSLMHNTPTSRFRLATIRVSADSAESGLTRHFYDFETNTHAIAGIDSLHPMAKTADIQHDPQGLEWEDHMGAANANSTSGTVTWILRDAHTHYVRTFRALPASKERGVLRKLGVQCRTNIT